MRDDLNALRQADFDVFKAIGIAADILHEARVHRVTHEEARERLGIWYKSAHLEGVAFPYLNPEDNTVATYRIRRDHPEVEADGKPIAKYISPPVAQDLLKVEEEQRRLLDDPSLPKRLKLLWLGVGTEDSSAAFPNTPHLLAMLQRHRINHIYRETDSDHTWINWRRYFNEFAPLLFR